MEEGVCFVRFMVLALASVSSSRALRDVKVCRKGKSVLCLEGHFLVINLLTQWERLVPFLSHSDALLVHTRCLVLCAGTKQKCRKRKDK